MNDAGDYVLNSLRACQPFDFAGPDRQRRMFDVDAKTQG